jgi:hypothetical protein
LRAFDRFIGIDWSGAKAERQSGIQVAEVHKTSCPQLRRPPNGKKRWSRHDVLTFIASLNDCRTLIGIDFAFSVPWDSGAGCLPACLTELANARDLWERINDVCKKEPHFYGGPIWDEGSPFRPFIHFWSKKKQYEREFRGASLFRKTEQSAKSHPLLRKCSLRPASIYQMTGPQVGAGSFAGMRVLDTLVSELKDIAIWPFDSIDSAPVVLIEIYPALFYALACEKRPTKDKIKSDDHKQIVRRVLKHWGVIDNKVEIPSRVDAIDAMVSAAALSFLAKQSDRFSIPYDRITAKEGWIFGVPFGGAL